MTYKLPAPYSCINTIEGPIYLYSAHQMKEAADAIERLTKDYEGAKEIIADNNETMHELKDECGRLAAELGDLPEAQAEMLSDCRRLKSENVELTTRAVETAKTILELTAENKQLTDEMADQGPCINGLRDKVVTLTDDNKRLGAGWQAANELALKNGLERSDIAVKLGMEIVRLTAERDALAKDAARIDWMEANPTYEKCPYHSDDTGDWFIPHESSGAGGFGGGIGYASFKTLRAALDAAIAKEQA